MTTDNDVHEAVYCTRFVAGFNIRYHQICEWRWGFTDRSIRAAVGILAVIGLWTSMKGPEWSVWAESLGVLSLLMAAVLNVFPTGDYEKRHGELFHRWNDLRRAADLLELKLRAQKVTVAIRERLAELADQENGLHGSEPAPWVKLLKRCEADERESLTGHRTAVEATCPSVLPVDGVAASSAGELESPVASAPVST